MQGYLGGLFSVCGISPQTKPKSSLVSAMKGIAVVLVFGLALIGASDVFTAFFAGDAVLARRLLFVSPTSSPIRETYISHWYNRAWSLLWFEFDSNQDGDFDRIAYCPTREGDAVQIRDVPSGDRYRPPRWQEGIEKIEDTFPYAFVNATWTTSTHRVLQVRNRWVFRSKEYIAATNAAAQH